MEEDDPGKVSACPLFSIAIQDIGRLVAADLTLYYCNSWGVRIDFTNNLDGGVPFKLVGLSHNHDSLNKLFLLRSIEIDNVSSTNKQQQTVKLYF